MFMLYLPRDLYIDPFHDLYPPIRELHALYGAFPAK